jgi:hypothetical protein
MAVGFPTKANWAAGDVLTASAQDDLAGTLNLLSNASASSGSQLISNVAGSSFAYQPTPSASNPVLNSAMTCWQRGTSIAITASSTSAYQADRWQGYRGATGGTISRQATGDTTNLPNIQYCARIQRDSGNASTVVFYLTQSFETVNSIPYAGKPITFSFYARAGANYSAASSALGIYIASGTGVDQNQGAGYTGQVGVINTSATLTTTWQRFTYTGTVPTTSTELAVQFIFTPTGTAGAADYFEVTGVQIDIGSVALPFRTYAATFQGELAACQRYFQKSYSQNVSVPTNSNSSYYATPTGAAIANGSVFASVLLLATMRTAPTVTIYSYTSSTTGAVSSGSGTDLAAGSGTIYVASDAHFTVYNNSGASITGANGMLAFHYAASAEL